MILPVFVAGILMLGILAATGKAQESSNNGNTEEPHLCLNEHTKTWQTCVAENSQKHGNSKTPSSQESSNNGKAQESSNTGTSLKYSSSPSTFSLSNTENAAEKANHTRQSSVPVQPSTPTTPQFAITPKAHMTTTNQERYPS